MRTGRTAFTGRLRKLFLPFLLLMSAAPSLSAEVSVEYQVIARSGVTPIPDGVGTFSGFNEFPAVDSSGNVLFGGVGGLDNAGQSQLGIYTALGVCCQKVMDRNTLLPGGQGDNFWLYGGTDQNDIDGGRVAFRASGQAGGEALYSNVGQASASELIEVAAIDGVDLSEGGDPWIDGDMVAMWGKRQPENENAIMYWDGFTSFEDPVSGYAIGLRTQASISGDASIFSRYKISDFTQELIITYGDDYEILVVKDVTPMPGNESNFFSNVRAWPVVDQGGLDAAFIGTGSGHIGVFKRVNGGPLLRVADRTTAVPGAGGQTFMGMTSNELALVNGSVAFVGNGTNLVDGIYTDVGGQLSVVVDDQANSIVELDGQEVELTAFRMGPKSFAYTPQGYMLVFLAYVKTGGSVIIRATIDAPPGGDPDSFTVYKDFSDNNPASVSVSLSCSSGTVTNSPQWASETSPAVFDITGDTAGASCTAAESVPSGYSANQTDCQNGDPLNGSCTIVNTLIVSSDSFTVFKDFSDDNSASVSVTLSCSSGTVTNNPQFASEASPAVFNIQGSNPSTDCTATEISVPPGYTANESECHDVPLREIGGCEIFNTATEPSDDMLFKGGFEN